MHPALQGETLDRESLFWHYPHYGNQGNFPGGAIREGDFKLVERYEDGRVHLYNRKEDIGSCGSSVRGFAATQHCPC